MKNIIIGGLVIAGLYFGFNYYKNSQFEEQYRQRLKNRTAEELDVIKGGGTNIVFENSYPEYLIEMTTDQLSYADIAQNNIDEIKKVVTTGLCEGFAKRMKEDFSGQSKLAINVLEEDRLTIDYTIKDRDGRELLNISHVMAECPSLQKLK